VYICECSCTCAHARMHVCMRVSVLRLCCVRVCCRLPVQYIATYCNILQRAATRCNNTCDEICTRFRLCNTLQSTATRCNTVPLHCNTLQTHYQHTSDGIGMCLRLCFNTLQHAATRCNTLQHTADTLQHTAMHCQHAATHCMTLQHTSTHL